MRQRDVSLDIIRIVACVFVVAMHSPMPSDNANGVFLVALSYFIAPCIGLFFMVSGALLLPVKEEYPTFLKKKIRQGFMAGTILDGYIHCIEYLQDAGKCKYHSDSYVNPAFGTG